MSSKNVEHRGNIDAPGSPFFPFLVVPFPSDAFFLLFYSVSHSRARRLTHLAADRSGVRVSFSDDAILLSIHHPLLTFPLLPAPSSIFLAPTFYPLANASPRLLCGSTSRRDTSRVPIRAESFTPSRNFETSDPDGSRITLLWFSSPTACFPF